MELLKNMFIGNTKRPMIATDILKAIREKGHLTRWETKDLFEKLAKKYEMSWTNVRAVLGVLIRNDLVVYNSKFFSYDLNVNPFGLYVKEWETFKTTGDTEIKEEEVK